MIKLKVSGNKHSFQLYEKVELINIELKSNFKTTPNSPITISYNNSHLTFENRKHIIRFIKEIRGGGKDKLILTLTRFKANNEFIATIENKKTTEIGLIKSIFLIYHWIELYVSNPKDLDVKKQIFDEFIIDWTNQPESQNDIYFIKEKHITKVNIRMINRLVELNLLASFKIIYPEGNNIQAYFIPLIKPGVSKEHFKSLQDETGNENYNFWKTILEDRDKRITKWINTRL